jgi:hypothetical protein
MEEGGLKNDCGLKPHAGRRLLLALRSEPEGVGCEERSGERGFHIVLRRLTLRSKPETQVTFLERGMEVEWRAGSDELEIQKGSEEPGFDSRSPVPFVVKGMEIQDWKVKETREERGMKIGWRRFDATAS